MIILGIDPGTASTGYGIIKIEKDHTPKIIECSVISTAAGHDMHKRLNKLFHDLHEVLDRHSPEVMVVERLFFNANVKTAMSVGQARGIPLLVAAQKNIQVFEYTALQAKKLLTGYGRANKKELQSAVKEYIGLDEILKPDDANDAVAMALCYLHKEVMLTTNKVTIKTKKTVKKVTKRVEATKTKTTKKTTKKAKKVVKTKKTTKVKVK